MVYKRKFHQKHKELKKELNENGELVTVITWCVVSLNEMLFCCIWQAS